MIDSDEIEVKIIINLNALVLKGTKTGIIRGIEEKGAGPGKIKQYAGDSWLSGSAGRILSGISQRNFIPPIETIVQLNHLEDREIRPYDTLILMKKGGRLIKKHIRRVICGDTGRKKARVSQDTLLFVCPLFLRAASQADILYRSKADAPYAF